MILEFKVSGHGTDLYGDGMAFWYVKHPMQPGTSVPILICCYANIDYVALTLIESTGSVFGSADFFWGLGVFLDTYANQNGAHSHGHPYISVMVNNATFPYDHDRDGTHTELAGCECKFRGVEHDTYLAIRYHNDTITIRTDIDGLCDISKTTRDLSETYLLKNVQDKQNA